MPRHATAEVQGPIQRRPNPAPRDDNPRRRRRKGKRRRNPRNPGITYTQGALIGATLGAIGVAISSAAKAPMPIVTTDAGSFAVSTETSGMRATKGALRGAALGLAVGLAATVVARELKVGSVGRLMNPAGPGMALILGSTVGATTLALDHGITTAMAPARGRAA